MPLVLSSSQIHTSASWNGYPCSYGGHHRILLATLEYSQAMETATTHHPSSVWDVRVDKNLDDCEQGARKHGTPGDVLDRGDDLTGLAVRVFEIKPRQWHDHLTQDQTKRCVQQVSPEHVRDVVCSVAWVHQLH